MLYGVGSACEAYRIEQSKIKESRSVIGYIPSVIHPTPDAARKEDVTADRSQLANVASQAKSVLGADHLDVVADRGYFNSTEILACEQADVTVTLPKPMTSGAKSEGRFGKQDFVYLPTEDV